MDDDDDGDDDDDDDDDGDGDGDDNGRSRPQLITKTTVFLRWRAVVFHLALLDI